MTNPQDRRKRPKPKGRLGPPAASLEEVLERHAPVVAARVARIAAQEADQPVTITLRTTHSINMQSYGPGIVTVIPDIAAILMEQESRVARSEAAFRAVDPPARIVLGRGGRSHLVPAEYLADFFGGMGG